MLTGYGVQQIPDAVAARRNVTCQPLAPVWIASASLAQTVAVNNPSRTRK